MASNTLLAGEHARRNKEVVPANNEAASHNVDSMLLKSNVSGDQQQPDWKMLLYQSSQLEQKAASLIDNYSKTQSFSSGQQDNVIGIHSGQQEVEDSTKLGNHFSNASSLVTSLSSSREGSPDRSSVATKLFTNPTNTLNSWIPSGELRPALSMMPHLPVFAAWTE